MSILLYDNIMIFHLYFCTVITFIVGFNTNVKHVVKLHGFNEPGSYFGFSVGIGYNKNTAKNVILVGAPRSNDPALPDVPRPGVVFACTAYQKIWNCSKLDIYNDSDLHEDVLVRRNESWLGGSIYVSASNIVATCAHKSDDWRDMYLDGECFEFPLEDIPSVSFSVRTYRGMSHHSANFGFGTSVHYTKNADNLLIGTAGFPLFCGGFLEKVGQLGTLVIQTEKFMDYDKYWALLGYASTSGKYFADGEIYYAFGAPREELKGRVVLFQSGQGEYTSNKSTLILEGFKTDNQNSLYYSYYGASLCTVDVNNDNIDDLLVGAPLYTPTINDTFVHDSEIGMVFVYLGSDTKMGFKSTPQTLKGIHSQGRFGSAIANLGDVNNDNFADIAIGAPYENNFKGTVYIYNGYIGGVWPRYSQQIRSSDLDTGLRGFGISITSGKDVNSDDINDMVVGSYLSDQAVVLFGQPHIVLVATLKVFNMSGLQTDVIELDKDKNETVKVCFEFFDRRCDYIRLNVTTNLDVGKHELTRLKFSKNNEASITSSLQVTRGKLECAMEIITKKSTNDDISEIVIQADYAVDEMSCPDLDIGATIRHFHASSPRDPVLQLRENFLFRKDCPGNVCKTDLTLTAAAKYDNISGHYLSGQTELAVDITITKNGDIAYGTVFHMVYPKYLDFINLEYLLEDFQIDCNLDVFHSNNIRTTYNKDESALSCLLGNLISNDTSVTFQVVFKATKSVAFMDSVLELQMLVTTVSTDLNPTDNNKTLSINLQHEPEAILHAMAMPKVMWLYEHNQRYELKHIYKVYNKEGNVFSTTMNISYPQIQKADKALLFLNKTMIHCGQTCNTDCRLVEQYTTPTVYSNVNDQPMSQTETPVTSLSDIKNSDCTKQTCSQLICILSNVQPKSMTYIQMEFEIDYEIQTIFKEESVEFISTASVEIGQGNIQSRQVSTTLKRKVISLFKKEVPWWIGVLSVLGGIVLLSLISLVLWKVGFFERKLRDELVKRKAQIPYSGQVTGKMPTLYSGQVTGKMPTLYSGQLSGKRVTDESGQVSGRKPTDDAGQVSGRCLTVDGGEVTGKKDKAKNSPKVTGQKPAFDCSDCDASSPLM